MGRRDTQNRSVARWGLCATGACLVAAAPAAAAVPRVAAKPAGLSPIAGVQDDRIVVDPDPAGRVRALADAGAALIRVDLRWDLVAASRPASPANPADPAYDWRQYDTIVATARAHKVQLLFAVYGTPAWARDPSVPFDARWENWSIRPVSADDFGAFGEAAARRYVPLGVRRWEGWNEANIALYLRPQYERRGNRWAAVSPRIYSELLKAFYAGVKRADPAAVVGGVVTAPAGDRCPDCPVDAPPLRVPPDDFVRALDAPGLRPPMDAVSHHPYPITGPRDYTPPGRTYIDLYNLDVFTRAVDRTYLGGKRLWLTEYGFATRSVPEYPTFFSPARQAAYIADAYRRFKANRRVALTTYFLLQDHSGWASGVLGQSGVPKPGYQALGLPFAAMRAGTVRRGDSVTLVGQARAAPGATTVQIQRRAGGRWVAIASVRTTRDGSFRIGLRPTARIILRAQWQGATRTGRAARRTSPPVVLTVR